MDETMTRQERAQAGRSLYGSARNGTFNVIVVTKAQTGTMFHRLEISASSEAEAKKKAEEKVLATDDGQPDKKVSESYLA